MMRKVHVEQQVHTCIYFRANISMFIRYALNISLGKTTYSWWYSKKVFCLLVNEFPFLFISWQYDNKMQMYENKSVSLTGMKILIMLMERVCGSYTCFPLIQLL